MARTDRIAADRARIIADLRRQLRERTRELQEARDHQGATSDVLKAISRSTFDLQPLLEALVATAARLCSAGMGLLSVREATGYRVVATFSTSPEYEAFIRGRVLPLDRGSVAGRTAVTGQVVHIDDLVADPEFTLRESITLEQVRTAIGVPLLRDGVVVGVFSLGRHRVERFTEQHIELVRTFADQAIIAIENTRLLAELRESYEHQRAVADLVQLINDSPGNLQPVFDAMVYQAMRLCEAFAGNLWLYENGHFVPVAVSRHSRLAEWMRQHGPTRPAPETPGGRLLTGEPVVHIRDCMQDPAYFIYRRYREMVDIEDCRTLVAVALFKEDTLVGMFTIYRQEVRLFSEREIALLKSFAGQAVVAMANARFLEEIRAARDAAQAALRELQVAQASLLHSQKMAALGQLTAGIAHEIKNPLNFVNNFAGLSIELLDELKAAAAPTIATLDDTARADIDETFDVLTGNLAKIAEHGRRADGIVKSMLEHSRGGSGDRRCVNVNGLVDEALNLAYHGARAQDQSFNITLERDFAADLAPVELVPQDVTRVFLNLIGNGFYAANKRRVAADDSFRPILKVSTCDAGNMVEIRVRDNGTGIAPEIRDKLFQPFVTTKPTGEGTGLGLSISYDIITHQHGGTITVDSEPGEFTEFTVRLPRNRGPASAGSAV